MAWVFLNDCFMLKVLFSKDALFIIRVQLAVIGKSFPKGFTCCLTSLIFLPL